MGVGQQPSEGFPLAEDRDLSLSGTQSLPHWLGWARVPEDQGCEQKASRILSVVLLFGGGSPKLFFSLELCLPKQETVVLCCHYFFF